MTIFQTCALFSCALAGAFFVVSSPSRRWSARKAKMSPEAIKEYHRQKNTLGLSHGCAMNLAGMGEMAQYYLIEPLYVIWAISLPIQPRWLAYAALSIIVVRTLLLLAAFVLPLPQTREGARFSWKYWTGVVVLSLPTLYLWFLLAVVIGLVR